MEKAGKGREGHGWIVACLSNTNAYQILGFVWRPYGRVRFRNWSPDLCPFWLELILDWQVERREDKKWWLVLWWPDALPWRQPWWRCSPCLQPLFLPDRVRQPCRQQLLQEWLLDPWHCQLGPMTWLMLRSCWPECQEASAPRSWVWWCQFQRRMAWLMVRLLLSLLLPWLASLRPVDLGKTLYYGINPTKFKTAKGKGSITPFMKRLIENGYWVMTTCTGLFLSGLKFFKCLGSRVQTWPGQCIESKTVKLRAWKP